MLSSGGTLPAALPLISHVTLGLSFLIYKDNNTKEINIREALRTVPGTREVLTKH